MRAPVRDEDAVHVEEEELHGAVCGCVRRRCPPHTCVPRGCRVPPLTPVRARASVRERRVREREKKKRAKKVHVACQKKKSSRDAGAEER